MPFITKEDALKIAHKLKADINTRKNKAHDIAEVRYEGILITSFGIRRGSKKNLGHDFITNDIFIGPHKTKLLAQCPLSREEWIGIITQKGKL